MDKTPTSNMGWGHTVRLQSLRLIHPNPGKDGSGVPAAPMRTANNGMPFPQVQDFFRMVKKSIIVTVGLAFPQFYIVRSRY